MDALEAAVIGAGPVGSLTALALARQGARVLLLEARPSAGRRLAGEWIHPPGAELLASMGVRFPSEAGKGFVVFPDDHGEPVHLPYGTGQVGLSNEHHEIVTSIREAAIGNRNVIYCPHARLVGMAGQRITYERDGQQRSALCGLIVGADGRSSAVRKLLGLPDRRRAQSCMAGLLLREAEVPFPGCGHVVLGGPGPALIYGIGPGRVRVCLDVPLSVARCKDNAGYLRDRFVPILPESLRGPFQAALRRGPIAWATNHVCPRANYGRGQVLLVGDAVGSTHPLTAAGMTLGFHDGACLARTRDLEAYQRQRSEQCRVSERLANALYAAFSRQDDEACAVRRAIFQMWRGEPSERACTMDLLCAGRTSAWQLNRVFVKVAALSIRPLIGDIVQSHQWRRPLLAWGRLRRQMLWLDGRMLPPASSANN